MPARLPPPSLTPRPRAALATTTRPRLILPMRSYAHKPRASRSPQVDYSGLSAPMADRRDKLRLRVTDATRNSLLYAGLAAMVFAGMAAFHWATAALGYGEQPEKTAEEREKWMAETAQKMDALPIVKALTTEDGWVEVGGTAEELQKVQRKFLEQEGLEEKEWKTGEYVRDWLGSSSHLLGPRRVWWNTQKGEGVSVGWVGQGTAGWPTVMHGGAIATVLVETVRLGWEKEWEIGHGAQQPPSSTDHPSSSSSSSTAPRIQPLQLSLTYLAPTRANTFYVVRFAPSPPCIPPQRGAETDLSPRKDMTKREADANTLPEDTTEEWTATLEKADGGKVGVKARVVMPRRETTTTTQGFGEVDELRADASEAKGAKRSWWKPWA